MLIKNRYFTSSAIFVVMQQIMLAISTYFIARAGNALFGARQAEVLHDIVWFFFTASLAYFLSSLSEYQQLKLKNSLWKKYIVDTYNSIQADMKVSSYHNKQKVTNWLTGEAFTTFENTAALVIELISLYCNVLLTLAVFTMTLGYVLTSAMVVSCIISIVLIKLFKRFIKNLASLIQTDKLEALVSINALWDNYLFGSKSQLNNAYTKFNGKIERYFKQTRKYLFIEQTISCLPIYISIPLVIWAMYYLARNGTLALGSVVAVLPRSLQLFGNIHSLSMYSSKALLIKYKLNNLKNFISRLEKQDLFNQITIEEITIFPLISNKELLLDSFLSKIEKKELTYGRFLITGKNGAGKSSLLKLIKGMFPETSILVAPGINFMDSELIASSGEHQMRQMELLLSHEVNIFLLDEWDANLDASNVTRLNEQLDALAQHTLVIEIRHKK